MLQGTRPYTCFNSKKLYFQLRIHLSQFMRIHQPSLETVEQEEVVWTSQSQGDYEEPDEVNVKIVNAFYRCID